MFSSTIRHAARRLLRDRGFTAAAVLALGLGIGGANGVFTLMNGIVLRGSPFRAPEQIVANVGCDRCMLHPCAPRRGNRSRDVLSQE
jgi:hypothetical protein